MGRAFVEAGRFIRTPFRHAAVLKLRLWPSSGSNSFPLLSDTIAFPSLSS